MHCRNALHPQTLFLPSSLSLSCTWKHIQTRTRSHSSFTSITAHSRNECAQKVNTFGHSLSLFLVLQDSIFFFFAHFLFNFISVFEETYLHDQVTSLSTGLHNLRFAFQKPLAYQGLPLSVLLVKSHSNATDKLTMTFRQNHFRNGDRGLKFCLLRKEFYGSESESTDRQPLKSLCPWTHSHIQNTVAFQCKSCCADKADSS